MEDALSELEAQKKVKSIAKKNKTEYISFLGGGVYNKFIPACVNYIAQRFENKCFWWYIYSNLLNKITEIVKKTVHKWNFLTGSWI